MEHKEFATSMPSKTLPTLEAVKQLRQPLEMRVLRRVGKSRGGLSKLPLDQDAGRSEAHVVEHQVEMISLTSDAVSATLCSAKQDRRSYGAEHHSAAGAATRPDLEQRDAGARSRPRSSPFQSQIPGKTAAKSQASPEPDHIQRTPPETSTATQTLAVKQGQIWKTR